MDGAAVNICVQVSPWTCVFTPLRCVPGCRLAGSHGAGAGGLLAQSCPTLQPCGQQPTRLLSPRDCPGKDTGEGCHLLLQGMFPTQGSNPCLLHWQSGSLPLSHLGSPDHVVTVSSCLRNCFPWRKHHFLPQQPQGSVSLSSWRLPLPFQLPGGCSDVSLISNDVGIERRHVLVGCLCIFLGEGLVQMHCPFSHEFVLFCFVSVVTELQELFVCSGYRSLTR